MVALASPLGDEAEARARDLLPGVGKMNSDGGGRSQVDPTGWMDGSDTAGDAERPICGLPTDPDVDPDRRDAGESREPLHLDVVIERGGNSPASS